MTNTNDITFMDSIDLLLIYKMNHLAVVVLGQYTFWTAHNLVPVVTPGVELLLPPGPGSRVQSHVAYPLCYEIFSFFLIMGARLPCVDRNT